MSAIILTQPPLEIQYSIWDFYRYLSIFEEITFHDLLLQAVDEELSSLHVNLNGILNKPNHKHGFHLQLI